MLLAVHSGALGDIVLFGRLLERLGGPVTLLAGGEKGRLLAGLGVVGRALDFDSLPMHEVFGDAPLETCALPRLIGEHDRLISCFATGERRAELRLAAVAMAGDATFLPVRPPDGWQGHLVELWADMLGVRAPAADSADWPAWRVPAEWLAAAKAALTAAGVAAGRPYAVLHPGSGGTAKCWPLERFAELADAIAHRGAMRPVFVVGPAEEDRWGEPAIAALAERFAVLRGLPLATLAAVLAGARLYVGNDSGPTHLAAAVGAPTVAIFGPSNPTHFAPLGPRKTVVCGDDLAHITVAQVLAAAAT